MANDLTGDFDVVAEFTLEAANRVLAAMHRGGRLAHSWSLRVDDYTHIHIPLGGIRSVVDAYGEAETDPTVVAGVSLQAASTAKVSAVNLAADFPVNQGGSASSSAATIDTRFNSATIQANDAAAGLRPPLHLSGVAHLQMGAPTVSIPANSNTRVTVHIPVMAWYTADANSLEIPSLLKGEFQITIQVQSVSSPAGKFVNVNLGGTTGNAAFVSQWVSMPWTSEAEQKAAINKAILNALQTSFEPSSTPLPPNISLMQFKALADDSQSALAMMMDLSGGGGNAADINNIFLEGGDDFAWAIGNDFLQAMFAPAINSLQQWSTSLSYTLETDIPNPGSILGWGPSSFTVSIVTITFTTIINSVTLELQGGAPGYPNGRILVTVSGAANTPTSGIPKISFTGTQALTLELIDSAYGSTADLIVLGDPTMDMSAPGIPDAVLNSFKSTAAAKFKTQVQSFLAQINPKLQKQFSVQNNLGNFLTQMMNPAPKPGAPAVTEVDPQLAYIAYQISSAGIVLRGTLAVPAWPVAHVNFSTRTVRPTGTFAPLAFDEYNALRSWIPGGTIQEFVWTEEGGGAVIHDDHHTFLFDNRKTLNHFSHLCLTIKGTRISAGGPITYQPVSAASRCSFHIPISARMAALVPQGTNDLPRVALTEKSASGGIKVVGHTSPWLSDGIAPEYTSNLIVYFPDQHSVESLETLPRALQQSGRSDAATGIIAVLPPDWVAKVKNSKGLVIADDDTAWSQLLGVQQRPATFLIDPQGDVVWQHQGKLTHAELAASLKANLRAGGRLNSRPLQSNLTVGQATPNFLFQPVSGSQLTLRKLAGRYVVLIFWVSSSRASLDTVLDLQEAFTRSGRNGPLLLAINDGEPAELAQRVAAENGISAVVVPDPERQIALAYGINVWPTSIFIDTTGLVNDIQLGRFSGKFGKPPAGMAAD
jgi:peroxiredoxin